MRKIGNVLGNIEIRAREELYINIHPIQAAGRLTPEAMKALIAYGDGYSVCDWCRKPFRLDKITKPPIEEFHNDLAKFLNMASARLVPGARRGFQVIVSSLVKKEDVVLLSPFAHYTEHLAIEDAGGIAKEIPLNEQNIVTKEAVIAKIEEVKKETGKHPVLIMIDHFDYMLGNEHAVYEIGKVVKEYGVPFLYNGAYTIGVMPIDGKKLGADFLIGSGHKSMASPAPSGVVATTEEWTEKIFRTTKAQGDLSKRKFGIKETKLLGCTLMGGVLVAMMASFPYVKKRVKNWEKEVQQSNYLIEKMLCIEGTKTMSEFPRKHTLTKIDTTQSFDKIAATHKRRGFFLSEELDEKRICGGFAGATKTWKLNTYGLSTEQIKYTADVFIEIAKKYNLPVR